jgi:hypothetical protein
VIMARSVLTVSRVLTAVCKFNRLAVVSVSIVMHVELQCCIRSDPSLLLPGLLLRGRTLPEVIHAIRTTVSEGGDGAVVLTMRRSALSTTVSTAAAAAPDVGLSVGPTDSALPVHPVSSVSSMTTSASFGSLSDGLGSTFVGMSQPKAGFINSTTMPCLAVAERQIQDSVHLSVLQEWTYVHHKQLDATVISADLVPQKTPASSVLLATVLAPKDSESCKLTVATASVVPDQHRSRLLLSDNTSCELTGCGMHSSAQVQLWPPHSGADSKHGCTVLVSRQSDSTGAGRDAESGLPVLLTTTVQYDGGGSITGLSKCEESALVPISSGLTEKPGTAATQWVLLTQPSPSVANHSGPTVTLRGTIDAGELEITASVRHNDALERVPLYLPQDNVLACHLAPATAHSGRTSLRVGARRVNALAPVLQLLKVLSYVGSSQPVVLSGTALPAGLCKQADGSWEAQGVQYTLTPLAADVVRALNNLTSGGGLSGVATAVDTQQLDNYSQRALLIQRLLSAATTPTGQGVTLLSEVAAANLLFADSTTQLSVLQMLLANKGGAINSTELDNSANSGAQADMGTDVLTTLANLHTQLWLRDLTPLFDVIYKNALTVFKRTKSSIQVIYCTGVADA